MSVSSRAPAAWPATIGSHRSRRSSNWYRRSFVRLRASCTASGVPRRRATLNASCPRRYERTTPSSSVVHSRPPSFQSPISSWTANSSFGATAANQSSATTASRSTSQRSSSAPATASRDGSPDDSPISERTVLAMTSASRGTESLRPRSRVGVAARAYASSPSAGRIKPEGGPESAETLAGTVDVVTDVGPAAERPQRRDGVGELVARRDHDLDAGRSCGVEPRGHPSSLPRTPPMAPARNATRSTQRRPCRRMVGRRRCPCASSW